MASCTTSCLTPAAWTIDAPGFVARWFCTSTKLGSVGIEDASVHTCAFTVNGRHTCLHVIYVTPRMPSGFISGSIKNKAQRQAYYVCREESRRTPTSEKEDDDDDETGMTSARRRHSDLKPERDAGGSRAGGVAERNVGSEPTRRGSATERRPSFSRCPHYWADDDADDADEADQPLAVGLPILTVRTRKGRRNQEHASVGTSASPQLA